MEETIEAKIIKLYNIVKSNRDGNKYYLDYDKLTVEEAEKLSIIAGTDLSNYKRTIDSSGLIHALKHENININDILLIPFIVKNYDFVGYGTKENTMVYKKTIGNEYFYVEEIRGKRKKLVLKTFYKRKKRLIKD